MTRQLLVSLRVYFCTEVTSSSRLTVQTKRPCLMFAVAAATRLVRRNLRTKKRMINSDMVGRSDSENPKSCWVCFANEDDEPRALWLRPCRCRGSTMWVHESCLQRWVDEKQKGEAMAKVSCAQCGTDYIIIYPSLNHVLQLLEHVDRWIIKACPLLTGGVILGSVYWTAVTYGAVTLMEMMGYKRAMSALEQAEPALLLIGLPTIPILLIVGKMIRWEDCVVRFLHGHFLPVPGRPGGAEEAEAGGLLAQHPAVKDPASATRILCGALALPTIAMFCGKWFLSGFNMSPFQRTLVGGLGFVAVKGLFKICLKHSQVVRKTRRVIRDFDLTPASSGVASASAGSDLEEED